MIREIGVEIKAIRKKKGLTQGFIAEGFCSQATISKIEKGTHVPNLETLKHICDRLNVPVEHFISRTTYDNVAYIEEVMNQIEEAAAEQDYKTVYDITKYELRGNTQKKSWYEIALVWNYIFSSYRIGKWQAEETILELKKLLTKVKSASGKMEDLYSRILNSIAIIYGELNIFDLSIKYFEKALENIQNRRIAHPSRYEHIFHIRVWYNLSKSYYDNGDYEKSLKHIHYAISICRKHESVSQLGQLLYYKGQCLEKQGASYQEIQLCYQQALIIFNFLEKKSYGDTIRKLKTYYVPNEADYDIEKY
ncbi:helix-turn-helix domain-containing protein [Salipaludibacillus daqingensis]|uniref:helix-turn-helix domain-containing protein n=1 Tax=Salipaludibacillus daqingensis TaxID=3041001 RepID=UPI0024752DBE|nr:helix-turn-helix domain-containing protein [Salipaludibacillus daqingensis]